MSHYIDDLLTSTHQSEVSRPSVVTAGGDRGRYGRLLYIRGVSHDPKVGHLRLRGHWPRLKGQWYERGLCE